jgi:hypothetical protein
MLLLTVFDTIIPMNEPNIKWRSNVDKCGDNEPTTNFNKFNVSKYISGSSSASNYLINNDNGSNKSLALLGVILTISF